MRRALLALLLWAGAASAQEVPFGTQTVSVGDGAVLRALDKLSGEVVDLEIGTGETIAFGRLQISLGECRFPRDNPSGNAYAWIVVRQGGETEPAFSGWMIAASPALNALDHPRYDVWPMRCTMR